MHILLFAWGDVPAGLYILTASTFFNRTQFMFLSIELCQVIQLLTFKLSFD